MIWLSMISSLFTASFALLTTGDSHPDAIRSKGTQIQARFSEPMDEKAAMGLADLGSRHDPGGSPPIQLIDEAFAAAQRVAEAFHERADADVEARGIHQHEIAVDDELAAAVQFDGVDFLNRNRCLDGKDALPAHLWLNEPVSAQKDRVGKEWFSPCSSRWAPFH